MPEEQQKTGEEDEQVLFASEGTLFQFDDQGSKTWRERGRGELRVNKAHNGAASQHTPCLLISLVHLTCSCFSQHLTVTDLRIMSSSSKAVSLGVHVSPCKLIVDSVLMCAAVRLI